MEISGDPHVLLRFKGQEEICFDYEGHNQENVILLKNTNLRRVQKVFQNHKMVLNQTDFSVKI